MAVSDKDGGIYNPKGLDVNDVLEHVKKEKFLKTYAQADKVTTARLTELDDSALPPGDVDVRVEYSSLNYKDALVLLGQGNLVKTYPHVGGIDFAGRVIESRDARYHPGQAVVLTGWRVGEVRWRGQDGEA